MLPQETRIAPGVALRPLRPSDIKDITALLARPEARTLHSWLSPDRTAPQQVEARYLPALLDPEGAGCWHYAIDTPAGLAGIITWSSLDKSNRSGALEMLTTNPEGWENGIYSTAVTRLLSLLFGSGDVHRVTASVTASCQTALQALRHAGFREEGKAREALMTPVGSEDLVLLGVLRREWNERLNEGPLARGPLRPEEREWFLGVAPESACEPYEIELALANDEILVWRQGGKPAVVASLVWRRFEMEIRILVVDKAFRRQGLASKVLSELREIASQRGLNRITLLTSNDNTPAVRLYQKCGFRLKALYTGRLERRRGFVRPGIDGIPIRDDIEMVWEF